MQIIQPQVKQMPIGILHWAQSVYRAFNKGLSFGQPMGTNATGVYNSFTQDNTDGILLRVGGSASAELLKWPGSNVAYAINHGLQRQPIGFIVCDKDVACDIYRTVTPPTKDLITLACTVGTANTTIYVF